MKNISTQLKEELKTKKEPIEAYYAQNEQTRYFYKVEFKQLKTKTFYTTLFLSGRAKNNVN